MHRVLASGVCVALSMAVAIAIETPDDRARFDHLARSREGAVIGIRPATVESLPSTDPLRRDWRRVTEGIGGDWRVWLDDRSGLPTLATLSGVRWQTGDEPLDVDTLAARAEAFLRAHPEILGSWGAQVELDRDASRPRGDHAWQIRFRQVVEGVPVEGARYDFHVSHGRLVAFGAAGWAPVRIDARPNLNADEAHARLDAYVRPTPYDAIVDLDAPDLVILPVDAGRDRGEAWSGDRGDGYDHRLVWRFRFQDRERLAIWTGEVDAHTGEIVAFYDDARYADIRGHVNPRSDDGRCDEGGCPVAGYPMPFVDYTEDGGPVQYAGQHGGTTCATPGATIETTLDGQYFRIQDNCGPITATATCDDDLDLGAGVDVNCGAAPGQSPGNTDASRSAYYSLNLVNRKARFWITGNPWLENSGVVCNTNVNSTCNANWGNDTINMFRAGNGCGNTSQIQAVVVHEWGHGFDENDGGGFDSSSEAYADVVAIFEARDSCVGPGFRVAQTCSGFGDTCISCTGVRDLDWMARRDRTPATPSGFLSTYCPSGSGPCGKAVHCESHVPGEAMFDLATRDLPAMGIDADSAWQLAERLWYQSRPGSGGDIFHCSLPDSDSCGTNGWYHQLRLQDDDDGDLMNGTPHAAAIFAAFDRHDIACGIASDPENQSTSSCAAIDAPPLRFTSQTGAVLLDWDPVDGADRYRLYRNENGCAHGQFPVAEVDAGTTTYLDDGLANGLPVYYRVQAIGTNPSCESPVSECIEAAAQATAGRVRLSRTAYGCASEIGIEVTDANHPTASITVTIRSDSESAPEPVVLGETSVGSSRFSGSILTTSAPASADGLLSIADGDTITVEYVDLDDGAGGANVSRQATATGDCVAPTIDGVHETGVTDFAASIHWATSEPAGSRVRIGDATPPTTVFEGPTGVTGHAVLVGGLEACTVYRYEVESEDAAGNVVIDDNRGAYFRFETYVDLGDGPQPCHQGRIAIEADEIGCDSAVPITVGDIDRNLDPGIAETLTVTVTSTTETTPETVTLTETGLDTGKFSGSIATGTGTPSPGDGIVQVETGDAVTATYRDDDDGAGYARTSFDSVPVDCDGSEISSVEVRSITDNSAIIAWTTAKETTGEVHWGPTPALGNVATDSRRTAHEVEISPFAECDRVYFRVLSTDNLGTTTVADASGVPFEFNAGTSGGVVYREDFDAPTDWALDGEWEVGTPQGLGSSPGDPTVAFAGSGVLGHDLTGLGAYPGDYEPETAEAAVSPAIDTSTLPGAELKFNRWLNVRTGTFAYLDVRNASGSWINVWKSPTSGGFTETAWSAQSFDVSAHTAGNTAFQVRFRNTSHIASAFHAGWNVDQLILRDTGQPDFLSCGGCGGAPSFAGVTSAVDADPCGDSGVDLTWAPAPSWGTGASGTYAIYRDPVPGFAPSPANRIASGVTGTSWTDATAPTGVTSYYVVRAESDETCAGGPNNGGMLDDNLVYASAANETSQPAPGTVGDSLRIEGINGAHALLTWSPAPDAAGYRVDRAGSPESPPTILGTTTELSFEDHGALGNSADGYYRVIAIDACGNDGPG